MLPDGYKKRFFPKFSAEIDIVELINELSLISGLYWATSYWERHCSIARYFYAEEERERRMITHVAMYTIMNC